MLFQGKDVVFTVIIQSMDLLKVPLWELPVLDGSCLAGLRDRKSVV